MNNGESIKKYNDILIKYLNDLVNSIEKKRAKNYNIRSDKKSNEEKI